jgi:magnesium transporter
MNMKTKYGLDPGSLVYVGRPHEHDVSLDVIQYNIHQFEERLGLSPSDLPLASESDEVIWVNIQGVHNADVIRAIGERYNIHILVLEDIMNTMGRPKLEVEDNCTFICGKMMEEGIRPEQFSIILQGNVVLFFQEEPGDTFDPIRDRIRNARGRVRTKNAEFLVYLILDNIVDNYIQLSQDLANEIDNLEQASLTNPGRNFVQKVLQLKHNLRDFRKSIDPLIEAVKRMQNEVDEGNVKYYRDLYDHVIHEAENIRDYNESLEAMIDLYHGHLGQKTNDTMRVLTVVSSIFVPLTFVAGIYGMNFDNMPELHWENGYFYALAAMGAIGVGILILSIRKKWL